MTEWDYILKVTDLPNTTLSLMTDNSESCCVIVYTNSENHYYFGESKFDCLQQAYKAHCDEAKSDPSVIMIDGISFHLSQVEENDHSSLHRIICWSQSQTDALIGMENKRVPVLLASGLSMVVCFEIARHEISQSNDMYMAEFELIWEIISHE